MKKFLLLLTGFAIVTVVLSRCQPDTHLKPVPTQQTPPVRLKDF